MQVTFEMAGGTGVASTTGSLTAASVETFRGQFLGWWDASPALRNVVLDLAQCDFVDSAGLGCLIALLKRVAERGGDLKICSMQKKVRMVFEITRAHRVFEILAGRDEAVRACG